MEPGSSEALTDIIHTFEPHFRNLGEAATGSAIGSSIYAAGRSALSNDSFYEALHSADTLATGAVAGLATAAGNPIDASYVKQATEYLGASITGIGVGAVGGPIVRSWGEREPFYENWQDKARENVVKGMVGLPAAYGAAELIQNFVQ